MTTDDVLIVGGGHGGAQVAVALRQNGFAGTIAIVTDEAELPYERPPLSKDYLAGEKPFERILIRPETFWTDRRIEIRRSCKVVAIDPVRRIVRMDDGGESGYGTLVWAAGGTPRRLTCAGHDLAGLHNIRHRADVDRLKAELPETMSVVVVGGGYIGLEAAAVLSKLGKSVTVLEAAPRVLARVAGEPLSRFYEGEHRAHGVDVRLSVEVDCIVGAGGRATGVRLRDGSVIPADMVVVGIGIVPAVQPILSAGAAGGNGVWVDDRCRTSLPDVFAVGDCALHRNPFAADDAPIRLESVQNANDQATVVARTIMGQDVAYHAVPWFWSNQFDLRLQTVGLSSGHDQVVVRGDPADRAFSVIYLRQGRVIALDCVDMTRDYVQGKAMVVNRPRIPPALLADPGVPLKTMAADHG